MSSNFRNYILYRIGWSIFALYFIFTLVFVLIRLEPADPSDVTWGGLRLDPYEKGPFLDAYLTWIWRAATLELEGLEYAIHKVLVTLTYVAPALISAAVIGSVIGLYLSIGEGRITTALTALVSYIGYGIPQFFLAAAIFEIALDYDIVLSVQVSKYGSPWALPNAKGFIVAGAVLFVEMVILQTRYTRQNASEHKSDLFVKTFRSVGADVYSIARHIFRYIAGLLFSIMFTEMFSALLLSIIVIERVFIIPGFGGYMYDAFFTRNLSAILIVTIIVVGTLVIGNLLQDIAYYYLDPRIRADEK